uniref:DDE-1 domain-containing protein n=1 Tax=Trichuris muris TaxID=70415 RepID=A0A5S6R5A9_TRIMR
MTAILFLEWFRQCFIPEVKSYLRLKRLPFRVLLVIDNAPGHPQSACFADEHVEVMFLPPNSTLLLQPLDQGIMRCRDRTSGELTGELGKVGWWPTSGYPSVKNIPNVKVTHRITKAQGESPLGQTGNRNALRDR